MTDEDLRFNVLNHHLVPVHEILPEEDVQPMLDQYDIVKEQLPKIKTTDPAVRVCDGKPGQIVKITRQSPTAGTFTAYRLIIEAI